MKLETLVDLINRINQLKQRSRRDEYIDTGDALELLSHINKELNAALITKLTEEED